MDQELENLDSIVRTRLTADAGCGKKAVRKRRSRCGRRSPLKSFYKPERPFVHIDIRTRGLENTDKILNKYFSNTFQIQTTYKEISVDGPPNERIYKMCVLDQNGNVLAEGEGRSKKKAEQQAAKNSLLKLGVIS